MTLTGIYTNVSCGCSRVVGRHMLGLKYGTYTFTKFLGDNNSGTEHRYEIFCDACDTTSAITNRVLRKICPKCRLMRLTSDGTSVYIDDLAKSVGVHKNAFRQRLKRMSVDEAMIMSKKNTGGCKDKHGMFFYRGVLGYVIDHVRRFGVERKKNAVYHWIRKGKSPADALHYCLVRAGVVD